MTYISMGGDSHEGNTYPLRAELSHAEQASCALKGIKLLAAADGSTGRRNGEDVGEASCGGCGAEKDKVWRDALRCSP